MFLRCVLKEVHVRVDAFRRTDPVALHLIAAQQSCGDRVTFRFDTFNTTRKAELLREPNGRSEDVASIPRRLDAAIELYLVQGELI